jgi:four helix bundle protein
MAHHPVQRFEDLQAWIRSRELLREVYALSKRPQGAGDRAWSDQIRRAAHSVMSNIAEGFERDGDREFVQALSMAKGSAGEVRSLLAAGQDLGYADAPTYERLRALAEKTSCLIAGLMRYLKRSGYRGKKFKEQP